MASGTNMSSLCKRTRLRHETAIRSAHETIGGMVTDGDWATSPPEPSPPSPPSPPSLRLRARPKASVGSSAKMRTLGMQ